MVKQNCEKKQHCEKNKEQVLSHGISALVSCNLESWLHSPRTLIMLGAALILMIAESFRNASGIASNAAYFIQAGFDIDPDVKTKLNIIDGMVLNAMNGFNSTISCMLFLVMISEIPMRTSFQYSSLIRSGKTKWIISQVLYCLFMAVMFVFALLVSSFIGNAFHSDFSLGWSDILSGKISGYPPMIDKSIVESFSPVQALLIASVPVILTFFIIAVFLLMMNMINLENVGIAVVACGFILDYVDVQGMIPISAMKYCSLSRIMSISTLGKSFGQMGITYGILLVTFCLIMFVYMKKKDISFDSLQ